MNQIEPLALALPGVVYQKDLSAWLRKTPGTLWRWVRAGSLPKPRQVGRENIWPASEIAAWAAQNGLGEAMGREDRLALALALAASIGYRVVPQ